MGGSESKGSNKKDHKGLRGTFNMLSSGLPRCKAKALKDAWKDVDTYLKEILMKYYFERKQEIDFDTFSVPFISLVHGTPSDKAVFLTASLKSVGGVKPDNIKKLMKIIVNLFLKASVSVSTWMNEGFQVSESRLDLFIEHLCEDLPSSPSLRTEELESWIVSWGIIQTMMSVVLHELYGLEPPDQCDIKVPECNSGLPQGYSKRIIDISSILFLNSYVDPQLRDKWRFLYSSSIHGESFSKLLGSICNKGPSIIIVEDKSSFVFGGFAPATWHLGPKFFGDTTSFLFTLQPSMNIFQPTGYNSNYQYLNIHQQTLPNGLGMGGQLHYFGLWLDAEFGRGHSSESCTTYQKYKMMSGVKEFSISYLEVWGLGPSPETDEPESRPSVLNDAKYAESNAMMQIMGRERQSEGIFEPVEQ